MQLYFHLYDWFVLLFLVFKFDGVKSEIFKNKEVNLAASGYVNNVH